MSIVSFIKDAGERLFKLPHPASSITSSAPAALVAAKPDLATLNRTAAESLKRYVASKGLPVDALTLAYDGATATVTVSGTVPDQATRERIVICCGNIASVRHVNDQISVAHSGDASDYYTVKSGDTLSKIAKQYYGSPDRFSAIFEANRPMLSDPDKIYPGQTLRVPKLS